jgi:uncharacterized repeat protein (TIGR01451 family)
MSQFRRASLWRAVAIVVAIALIPQSFAGATQTPRGSSSTALASSADDPVYTGLGPLKTDEEAEEELLKLDFEFISKRLAGDHQLTLQQAGALRAAAAHQAQVIRQQTVSPAGQSTFSGAWSALGPNPIQQLNPDGTLGARSGRIGALAIRPSNGQWILGGANGGIWLFDDATGTWVSKTEDLPSLAIGALAIAPSDDSVVYAGTGEGALSGDSYFGNGILKSTDGGQTWAHVSGDYFEGVSTSRIVVDPGDANHLYASILRGRGGARRTSPTLHSKYGIWESHDGGVSWTLIFEQKSTLGATDLEMDPQDPQILYSSFWGDQVYKSTDGGAHWAAIMNGLPMHFNAANATRFSIGLSHPAGQNAVLYVGTDFIDANGDAQASRLWRSDDGGASWHVLPTTGFSGSDDSVLDYCGGQCFYDNVVEVDPNDTNIVYAAGQFNYAIGSGGVYRSDDGGQTWKNLGFHQHPDFHALAFGGDPANVLIGSDGGVWFSEDRGGREPGSAGEGDLTANDWVNLNGGGLQITQFSSIANNPTFPARVWGGSQDNGTERKSATSQSWFDLYGGDGGQVLVDPTDFHYNYGTYFGITPYRSTDGGGFFNSNQYIRTGLNLNDRSEFYVPWVLNKQNPNQLFLGTYRLYRTDNAKAASAAAVTWHLISPDLTTGCTGTAPNGARTCAISAIGIGGGSAAYVGTLDGLLWVATDAMTASSPTWTRLDQNGLPKRPVGSISVDSSNYRIAYVGYNGFNAATPARPGHVFKTTDGGHQWTNITGNLPDSPVNSLIVDPSYANTLYAGTDVGPFVTYDGGGHWNALGTDFPIDTIWQLDLDPTHRTMAAGTHGRGAYTLTDATAVPALVLDKVDAGVPIGPNSDLTYTLTLHNWGNADATGVTITDPIPANTSFVSADSGGTYAAGKVTWTGLTVPAWSLESGPGSVTVHMTVNVAGALKKKITQIVNDGYKATSAEGPYTTGSPTITHFAPPYAVSLTPASQSNQARPGQTVNYALHLKNDGFNPDTYGVATSGSTFTAHLFQADCTTALGASVGPVAPGATVDLCVGIDIPANAANNATDTTTVTATSTGSPSVTASATVSTTAAAADTLLVDEDGNGPDVQSYYAQALTDAGVEFNTWDLASSPTLPQEFLTSFTNVVWFTGNSYPGPLLPYESELAAFLDGGGHLLMSGQDILDQAAGTTAFVHDYLHINWDGSETQNDKETATVTGITGNPVTDGIGAVPLDHSVLGAAFEDRVTPIDPATAAFNDDSGAADALNVDTGTYKVVFLAFPMEAYGTAADKADLVARLMAYFGP